MMKSSSSFDKVLEKATSHLLLDPDWSVNLAICDMIRQGDVQAKYAVVCTKKRLYHQNPHVSVLALHVLEAMVKNCGAPIHEEVAQLGFMQEMRELIVQAPEIVKSKLLELLQTWAFAFRQSPRYSAVQDTVTVMKAEGFEFPVLRESDAMFSAETAPEWSDGEACHRCRDAFTTFNRKHHCRACGQVFCSKCSSKMSNIPKYGIERDVRVCDPCFDQINKMVPTAVKTGISGGSVQSPSPADSDLPPEYLASPLSKQSQAPPPARSATELKEEEELNLALAISQSEAEAKEQAVSHSSHLSHKQRVSQRSGSTSSSATSAPSNSGTALKSALKSRSESVTDRDPEADPELARYLNRSYWESRHSVDGKSDVTGPAHQTVGSQSAPGAGAGRNHDNDSTVTSVQNSWPQQNVNDGPQSESQQDRLVDGFVPVICSQLEIFINRMKSNSSRGRPISNDSSVQTMFVNTTAMHAQLLQYLQGQDDRRVHYESLQDQLAQVRDARAALDALREEHREQLRREAEEAQRLRQLQMMQKLEIMRKKKQEYLQYQRQVAMQRMQEQEREMARRYDNQQQQMSMMMQQQQQYPPQQWQQPIAGYGMPTDGYIPPQQPVEYAGAPVRPQFIQDPAAFNMHAMTSALPTGHAAGGGYQQPMDGYQGPPLSMGTAAEAGGPPMAGQMHVAPGLPPGSMGSQGPVGHQDPVVSSAHAMMMPGHYGMPQGPQGMMMASPLPQGPVSMGQQASMGSVVPTMMYGGPPQMGPQGQFVPQGPMDPGVPQVPVMGPGVPQGPVMGPGVPQGSVMGPGIPQGLVSQQPPGVGGASHQLGYGPPGPSGGDPQNPGAPPTESAPALISFE